MCGVNRPQICQFLNECDTHLKRPVYRFSLIDGQASADNSYNKMNKQIADAIVFVIGLVSNFTAMRIFCAHCFLAISIVFLYQITAFAALLALNGYREQARRHCLTLLKVDGG